MIIIQLKQARKEEGMAIVAALFMIVVLGALGVLAIGMWRDQQGVVNLHTLIRRAEIAANMGVEWAAARTATGSCDPDTILVPDRALSGFRVRIRCTPEGTSFAIRSEATFDPYGSPTRVKRSVDRRLPD